MADLVKKIIVLLSLFLFFLSADSAEAALNCSIASSCGSPNVTVLRMSALTNSHAELPSQTNYNNYICCGGVTGLGNNCGAANKAVVLKLSAPTNAHLEKNTGTAYSGNNACLSAPSGYAVDCSYTAANCSDLGPNYVQLACISGDTNAHVDNCSVYSTKVCCAVTSTITCGINVPSSGLAEEWILINVSSSQGAIESVKFSSDNIFNGSPDGSWDGPYDWNVSSGNWDAVSKTMKWSFTEAGSYEVWAEVIGSGGLTDSDYDTIVIYECYPGQTENCASAQGCIHTITCRSNGTWPSCPADVCIINTPDSVQCPCPGADGCIGNDYYDYPAYGDCSSSCSCNVGSSPGQPCAPTIYPNDSRCIGTDQCNSDADCEDGNSCTNNWCERPADSDSVCHRDNLSEGTSCGVCKKCDGSGNCISRPDGYDTNECGAGCQRCIYGSCGDYHSACDPVGNNESSCECRADSCIDCSDYYDGDCGYQGICHCGSSEKPVWSCSNWSCSCLCQYDASCEWESTPYPEVIIEPPSQEGNPGEELPYEITIINQDDEEHTYTIIPSLPSGWSYWLEEDTVTVSVGQSTTVDFRVTLSEGASAGEYDISVTAQNAGAPEFSGTGWAEVVIPNQPPDKPEPSPAYPGGVSWDHCSIQALSLPTFHWIYSDPEGDLQASYEIRLDNDPNFSIPEPEEFKDSKDSSSPRYTPSTTEWRAWMSWNTNYWWIVRVKDEKGNWSEWSNATAFATPSHAAPSPDFAPSKERVSQGEMVTFVDDSKCYTSPGNTEFDCRDLAVSYEWDFDYVEPVFTVPADSTVKGNVTWSYTLLGARKVKLRIDDDIDTCYSDTRTITVTLPLPTWWEIPPF